MEHTLHVKRHRDYNFAITPEWILYHSELSGNDVRVFATLDRIAGEDPEGHPRISTLAERCHISSSSVRRSIARLEAVGALRVEPTLIDGKITTTNRYFLAGSAPWPSDPNPLRERQRALGSEGGQTKQRNEALKALGGQDSGVDEPTPTTSDRPSPLPPAVAPPYHQSKAPPTTSGRHKERESVEREPMNERTPAAFAAESESDDQTASLKAEARRLAQVAFEQPRKPVTKGGFVAVLKRIQQTLEAGYDPDDIERAIRDGSISVWTLDAISLALTRSNPKPLVAGRRQAAPDPFLAILQNGTAR